MGSFKEYVRFSYFLPLRERLSAASPLLPRVRSKTLRLHPCRLGAEALRRLQRWGILEQTKTGCFAWALIPNYCHLLLQTGTAPIATVMRRLLTGHALFFNRRHRCSGHLFQNRYKSILCQEDTYPLELVRYIHLNPLRAKLVIDMDALGKHPFSGHGVIMGKHTHPWQNAGTYIEGTRRGS